MSAVVFVPGGQLTEVDSRQQGQRARTHSRQTWFAVSESHISSSRWRSRDRL